MALSFSFLVRESSQCFSFGLGVLFFVLSLISYCFYVEIHAEFSCISKRENVGGMVIDHLPCHKIFSCCVLAVFVRDL